MPISSTQRVLEDSMCSRFAFRKASRLLDAHQYKYVFDNTRLRVSHAKFLILTSPPSDSARIQPRLGLIIAKKNVRLATQRNRIKRVIRESFRSQQHTLPTLDIVVLARKNANDLSQKELHHVLNDLWRRLTAKARRPASSNSSQKKKNSPRSSSTNRSASGKTPSSSQG